MMLSVLVRADEEVLNQSVAVSHVKADLFKTSVCSSYNMPFRKKVSNFNY